MNNTILNVLDLSGQSIGEYSLNPDVFNIEYNQSMVHEVIRWQLNKKRKPIQKAKIRSEVSGSRKKIRAQKGSGKARQGDGKAPHFRGGGVAFGIEPRTYGFKLNKKFIKKALCSFLSQKARNGEIKIINDSWSSEFDKTKTAKHRIEKITEGKPCTIVCDNFNNTNGLKILYNVNLLKTVGINIHSCIKGLIIFHLDALKNIENRLSKKGSK